MSSENTADKSDVVQTSNTLAREDIRKNIMHATHDMITRLLSDNGRNPKGVVDRKVILFMCAYIFTIGLPWVIYFCMIVVSSCYLHQTCCLFMKTV